jgi:hypothetical protein
MLEDLTNYEFGHLTVLGPAPRIKGRLAWYCRCKCGNEKVVKDDLLKSGSTRSCGCLKGGVIDLTGRVFTYITVLSRAPKQGHSAHWNCRCKCGKELVVRGQELRNGNVKSCGCYSHSLMVLNNIRKGVTHGDKKHPLYAIWWGMIRRCEYPGAPNYRLYGARGIRVCDAWKNMSRFIEDLGERPGKEYTLDRIDVNGHYEPGNVRWATASQQARNRRPFDEWGVRKRDLYEKVERLEIANAELKKENREIRKKLRHYEKQLLSKS